jgi:uncharacterized protein (TIGR03067 family)
MAMKAVLAVCGVVLLLGVDDAKDTKLKGTWTAVTAEKGGQEQADAGDHTLTFDGDTFTISRKGQTFLKGTFKVDETQKPKTIDMEIKESPKEEHKGKTVLGIYELDGDNLKWCAANPGATERPKSFKTEAGSDLLLVTLKREKK